MKAIEQFESEVRSYVRNFPTVFTTATGYTMTDDAGKDYIDLFSGAGVLNYGHNHPAMIEKLLEYIKGNGITHSLDMATVAKQDFLQTFHDIILKPRNLDYRVQFPGPTGTNTVEAALKLARKVKGRDSVISFTNAFHGMTLGALSITGNAFKRSGAGVPLSNSASMPFDGYFGDDVDTVDYLEQYLQDGSSGIDLPAAIIVETVQCEGGINVASEDWIRRMAELAKRFDILFIVDDIQTGNGRTGPFFSFEKMGVYPDIVCVSKSLSGIGQPISITLMRPELDIWEPGEHNGTFRGNNYAFVTAAETFRTFWQNDDLSNKVEADGQLVFKELERIAAKYPETGAQVRGRGMVNGIDFPAPGIARDVCRACFDRGVIAETSGPDGNVAKVMPPLIIDEVGLRRGLQQFEAAIDEVIKKAGDHAHADKAETELAS